MSETPTLISRQVSTGATVQPDPPELKIFGPAISDLIAIPHCQMGLLCGSGEAEGRPVLVPYLQLRLLGAVPSEGSEDTMEMSEAFAGTLAFDNAAFLIMDLVRDFRGTALRLKSFSSGDLKPEPARLTHAKQYLERAKSMIDTATAHLDAIIAECPPVVSPKPKARPRTKLKSAQKAES